MRISLVLYCQWWRLIVELIQSRNLSCQNVETRSVLYRILQKHQWVASILWLNGNIHRGNDGISPKEGWSRKALWTISVSVDMARGSVLSDANLSKLFLLLCNWVNEGDWWRACAKTYCIKARSLHAVGVLESIENIRLNAFRSNNSVWLTNHIRRKTRRPLYISRINSIAVIV